MIYDLITKNLKLKFQTVSLFIIIIIFYYFQLNLVCLQDFANLVAICGSEDLAQVSALLTLST